MTLILLVQAQKFSEQSTHALLSVTDVTLDDQEPLIKSPSVSPSQTMEMITFLNQHSLPSDTLRTYAL